MSNLNKPLSASELAQIITGAIVREFAAIGLVAVNAHPAAVPPSVPSPAADTSARVAQTPSQPRATSRKGQTAPVAVAVALPHVAPAQTVERKAPEGLSALIGGEKDSRIKLPKGLFQTGYSTIVLVFDDGHEEPVTEDTEGRGRISRKLACEHSHAQEGQYLVFAPRGDGYFDVRVSNGQTVSKASKAQSAKAAAHSQGALTAAVPVAAVPLPIGGIPQAAPQKPKQPGARCVTCGGPGIIGKTVQPVSGTDGYAHKKCMAQAIAASKGKVAPVYAQGNAPGRPAPAHNVGASQKRYAAVPLPTRKG